MANRKFVGHLTEAECLNIGGKILVHLRSILLNHFLIVGLVLKGADPKVNRLGLDRNYTQCKQEQAHL